MCCYCGFKAPWLTHTLTNNVNYEEGCSQGTPKHFYSRDVYIYHPTCFLVCVMLSHTRALIDVKSQRVVGIEALLEEERTQSQTDCGSTPGHLSLISAVHTHTRQCVEVSVYKVNGVAIEGGQTGD